LRQLRNLRIPRQFSRAMHAAVDIMRVHPHFGSRWFRSRSWSRGAWGRPGTRGETHVRSVATIASRWALSVDCPGRVRPVCDNARVSFPTFAAQIKYRVLEVWVVLWAVCTLSTSQRTTFLQLRSFSIVNGTVDDGLARVSFPTCAVPQQGVIIAGIVSADLAVDSVADRVDLVVGSPANPVMGNLVSQLAAVMGGPRLIRGCLARRVPDARWTLYERLVISSGASGASNCEKL
jgi:hypothetical protein